MGAETSPVREELQILTVALRANELFMPISGFERCSPGAVLEPVTTSRATAQSIGKELKARISAVFTNESIHGPFLFLFYLFCSVPVSVPIRGRTSSPCLFL